MGAPVVSVGASIAAKELLPIIVATAIWGPSWRGSTVLCHCDNEAVVVTVKSGYCRDPTLAHMLRCLFFLEAKYDTSLSAIHVSGVENGAADSGIIYPYSLIPSGRLIQVPARCQTT